MQGLQKQLVPINLGQGLDTDTDPKSVIPGRMTTLENAEFNKGGRIDKRDGGTLLDNVSVSGGKNVFAFKDQLLRLVNNALYSYAEQGDEWVLRGYVSNCEVATDQVASSTIEPSSPAGDETVGFDVIEHNGIIVYGRYGEIAALDATTGAVITTLDQNTYQFGWIYDGFKCVGWGDYIYIFYNDDTSAPGNFVVRRLDTTDPSAGFSAETVIFASRCGSFDAIVDESIGILVVHEVINGGSLYSTWIDQDMVQLSSPRAQTALNIGNNNNRNVCLVAGPSSTYYLGFNDVTSPTSTYMSYAVIDDEQNIVLDLTALTSTDVTGQPFGRITGYNTGSGVKFFFTVGFPNTNTGDLYLETATGNSSGVTSAATTLQNNLTPISKVFTYNGKPYFLAGQMATAISGSFSTNNVFFLIDGDTGQVVSKHLHGLTPGRPMSSSLATVSNPSTGVFKIGMTGMSDTASEIWSYHITTLDFSAPIHTKQLGEYLLLCGGFVSIYDGKTVAELNFHHFPEIISVVSAASGGSMASGTYQYRLVYEWTDQYGVLHQSATSVAVSGNHASGSANKFTITALNYRITQKENVKLTLYRTEADGDVFYRVDEFYRDVQDNDPEAYTTAIEDTLADADIISNPILYTEGGVLDNEAPPAAGRIESFGNRFWLGRLENGNEVWYSHEERKAYPPRFNPALSLRLPDQANPMNAFGVLGDKILAYRLNDYKFTYGEGPNELGEGGSFAPFQSIPSATGVKDSKSVVSTPLGLMFKSSKGIYLTDTSLQSQYIGEGVDEFNDETVTSGVLMTGKDQVRFTTLDGDLLVYDYQRGAWATFTNRDAYDACIWKDDTYVVLRNTGTDVIRESVGTYRDGSTDYSLKFVTGWISLSSIVGIQRIYKLLILGDRYSTHTLRVSVAYDYSETYDDTVTLAPDTMLDDGASGYYPYRLVVPLKRQKCQAIRFMFEELTPGGTYQSLNISYIGLEVGLKKGFAKIRATQKSGVS